PAWSRPPRATGPPSSARPSGGTTWRACSSTPSAAGRTASRSIATSERRSKRRGNGAMGERLEAKYGLPEEAVFCSRCVMSNQRPTSTVEFKHRADRKARVLFIDEEGVCDACRFAEQKEQ